MGLRFCAARTGGNSVKDALPGLSSIPSLTAQSCIKRALLRQIDNKNHYVRPLVGCFDLPTTWLGTILLVRTHGRGEGR